MVAQSTFSHRLAILDDIPAIVHLMKASIAENMKAFLSSAEIEIAQATMGLDQTLIRDKTYYIIEYRSTNKAVLVGCGGWSFRKTLYGGDHSPGRDDSLQDPLFEPARIRAMYTHPQWTRQGVGSLLLSIGEEAARAAGFLTIELGSTIPGVPLYQSCGYIEVGRDIHSGPDGIQNVIVRMSKRLSSE
ncbi:MAG: GNAT family N-acetyltransferase [Myxococcales bacterium]|nr:GNAT family N-acetyltransferase [Myxococcales bacterium]